GRRAAGRAAAGLRGCVPDTARAGGGAGERAGAAGGAGEGRALRRRRARNPVHCRGLGGGRRLGGGHVGSARVLPGRVGVRRALAQEESSLVLTEQVEITADDPVSQYSGQSVAASGNTLLVGAASNLLFFSGLNEAAYVFVNAGGTWVQQAKLISSDQADKDLF